MKQLANIIFCMPLIKEVKLGKRSVFASVYILAFFAVGPAWSWDERLLDAFVVAPSSGTPLDVKYMDLLKWRGVKVFQSFPPDIFMGHVPLSEEAFLKQRFGAKIYRGKINVGEMHDMGENAAIAMNYWNARFSQEAPPPITHPQHADQSDAATRGTTLSWQEVMKATAYHLQISADPTFSAKIIDTRVNKNSYRIHPAFWDMGTYYWRVSALIGLNTGKTVESPFSEITTFNVSAPRMDRAAGGKVSLPNKTRLKDRPISWPTSTGSKYYRLQVSSTPDMAAPILDIFTDRNSQKVSGLPLEYGTTYFMRVMAADEDTIGNWSNISEMIIDQPDAIANDARGPHVKQ